MIRSVSCGSEVNIDYGFDFYANPKEKRAKRADGQYHFTCGCVACTEDWPTYDRLASRVRQFQAEVTPEVIVGESRDLILGPDTRDDRAIRTPLAERLHITTWLNESKINNYCKRHM